MMKLRFAFLLMFSALTGTLISHPEARGDILSAVPPDEFRIIGDLTNQLSQAAIDDAKQSLVQGDFRGAREKLQKINETHKDLPLPELIISSWLFELNFPVMGTQIAQQLGFTHGKRQDVQIHLAQIAMTQARFYEASLLIEAALQSPPEPEWSEAFRATMLMQIHETQGAIEERRNRMAEAKEIYTKLLEENPHSVKALLGLARSNFALGELAESESHFRKLEELVPAQAPITEVAISSLFLARNDAANGETWLKKGLERTGNPNSIARLEYARFLLKANRPEEARKVLIEARASEALKPELAFHIALAEQMAGRFDKSLPILLGIRKTSPNNFAVSNHLAWALLQSPDSKVVSQGARLAQQNMQNNPTSIEAIATNAWGYFKRGDLKSADTIVSRPLPSRNFSRDAAFFFAEILEANGKTEEATSIRERVLTASGDFYHARIAAADKSSQPGENGSLPADPPSDIPSGDAADEATDAPTKP